MYTSIFVIQWEW